MSDTHTEYLKACMSAGEETLLRSQLSQASVVLEFGIGGSTGIAAEYDLVRLIGVDSHPDWIDRCQRDPRISALAEQDRVTLRLVNIGPVKQWGIPVDQSHAHRWPRYSLEVWSQLGELAPDFVFIDGRFRLSCALQALLRLPNLKALGIHDFWSRPHYHPVLDFTDVMAREGELAILAPKVDIDLRQLAELACEQLLDAR